VECCSSRYSTTHEYYHLFHLNSAILLADKKESSNQVGCEDFLSISKNTKTKALRAIIFMDISNTGTSIQEHSCKTNIKRHNNNYTHNIYRAYLIQSKPHTCNEVLGLGRILKLHNQLLSHWQEQERPLEILKAQKNTKQLRICQKNDKLSWDPLLSNQIVVCCSCSS
jgi:hypothetical protein